MWRGLPIGAVIGLAAANAAGAETVVADLSSDQGPALGRAAGLVGTFGPALPDSVLARVVPKFVRSSDTFQIDAAYDRLKPLGTTLEFIVSDSTGYGASPWPGDNGDYSRWESIVTTLAERERDAHRTYEWDIWNEPGPAPFWGRDVSQWLETWRRGVLKLRAVLPDATVVGPSIPDYDEAFLQQFLTYAQTNGVLPNVVSWHELYPQTSPADIPGHALRMRGWLGQQQLPIQRLEINEYSKEATRHQPAYAIWYIANLERARVDASARTCWLNSDGTNDCGNDSLNGMLTNDKQPRSVYWVYSAYHDVNGRLFGLSPTPSLDGIVGTTGADSLCVILGNHSGAPVTATLEVDALRDWLVASAATQVHVSVDLVPDTDVGPLAAPNRVLEHGESVTSPNWTLDLPSMTAGAVAIVSISRPPSHPDAGAPQDAASDGILPDAQSPNSRDLIPDADPDGDAAVGASAGPDSEGNSNTSTGSCSIRSSVFERIVPGFASVGLLITLLGTLRRRTRQRHQSP
jgi:hypothetical protein